MRIYLNRILFDKPHALLYNNTHLTTTGVTMLLGTNPQGDNIMVIGDMILNYKFWDCDCSYEYIRSVKQHHCTECGSDRDDSEISQETEVQLFIYNHASQE